MSGTIVCALHELSYLILKTTRWRRYCDYPHFTDKQTKAEKSLNTFPQVTRLITWQSWVWTQGFWYPRSFSFHRVYRSIYLPRKNTVTIKPGKNPPIQDPYIKGVLEEAQKLFYVYRGSELTTAEWAFCRWWWQWEPRVASRCKPLPRRQKDLGSSLSSPTDKT